MKKDTKGKVVANKKEEIWDHLQPVGDCWEWTGSRDDDGYGSFKVAGVSYRTHRLAYELAVGPIPEGLQVLHSCDNPPCCRPDHVFLGTPTDNMRDKQRKGRQATGDHVPPEHRHRGAQHWTHRIPERVAKGVGRGRTKLTDIAVSQILRLWATGDYGQRQLARMFDVNSSSINKIVHGVGWKHIPR